MLRRDDEDGQDRKCLTFSYFAIAAECVAGSEAYGIWHMMSMAVLAFRVWCLMSDAACSLHARACTCMYLHVHACPCSDRAEVLVFQRKTGIWCARPSTRSVSPSSACPSSGGRASDVYIYLPVDTRAVRAWSMAEVEVHSPPPAAMNSSLISAALLHRSALACLSLCFGSAWALLESLCCNVVWLPLRGTPPTA